MEKTREYKYDNLKFILIFLVVFGHLLELINAENINKIIYVFHMPMFIYISGYFSKCNFKSIVKKLFIYFLWQTIYFLVYRFLLNLNTSLSYLKRPIWIMWYMYALIVWEALICIYPFKEKNIKPIFIVAISFIISLFAGFIDKIGYDFSLSRIITFFPFFLIGYYQKNRSFNLMLMSDNSKENKIKIFAFSIIAFFSVIYFVSNFSKYNIRCLYGAFSYKDMGYNIIFKTMWILMSVSIMFLLNNIVSSNKIKYISKIGSNTLYIYLIHGIIVKLLGQHSDIIFRANEIVNVLICLVLTVIILSVLGNDYYKKGMVRYENEKS